MESMSAKLFLITPEILLFAGAVAVAVLGLARTRSIRRAVPATTFGVLVAAAIAAVVVYGNENAVEASGLIMPRLGAFAKPLIALAAAALVLIGWGAVDRRLDEAFDTGRAVFDPIRVVKGEYHAFLLLSVMGAMLVPSASDLIWLFLALELSSLPTYVMVALSRGSRKANEAAVKYFFLGAMSAAMFLYGFAMLYGATGTLELSVMRDVFAEQAASAQGIPFVGIVGLILAILGIAFKIAAVPMHFYAPDVYEGAATHVTAFLSFIPKATGMLALVLLCTTIGFAGHGFIDPDGVRHSIEGLPPAVATVLFTIAALTMTLGNIGALLQTSVRRIMAYSGIAHSGYMLIGLLAGAAGGIEAILFYLTTYAVATIAAFGVLGGLERNGHEVETLDDLAGLGRRSPMLAAALALAAGSFLGLPPLLGFWGKFDVLLAGVGGGHVWLVVIAVANSAISAGYYLAIAGIPIVSAATPRSEATVVGPTPWPRVAAIIAGLALLIMPFWTPALLGAAERSADTTIAASADLDAPVVADAD